MKKITATVSRGKHANTVLTPHRYQRGCFLVSKGGNTLAFAKEVRAESELENWIQRGYGLRMSAPGHSPVIIAPQNIRIELI